MTTTEQTPSQYAVVFRPRSFPRSMRPSRRRLRRCPRNLERSSQEFHVAGALLMAGAFLDQPEEPVCTMAVLATGAAAEDYARGDPFARLTRSMSGRFVNGRTCSPDGNRQPAGIRLPELNDGDRSRWDLRLCD